MLEILVILVLANKNAQNAAARGRKPGGFRWLTLALWFGGELLGFFIGMAVTNGETLSAYGVALFFAFVGGIISYNVAKNCKPGEHQELQHAPLAGARPLDTPCNITVMREKSFVSALVTYGVYLNGKHVGNLKNGGSLQVPTDLVQNVIVAKDSYGTELRPLFFAVPSGGSVQVVFGPQRFIPEKCVGVALLSDTDILPLAQGAQNTPTCETCPQAEGARQAPQYHYEQQSPTPAPLPEAPMRAAFVLGSALLFMLLSAFVYLPQFPLSYDVSVGFVSLAYSLALGAGVYLMLQEGTKFKIIAVAGMLLASLMRAFSASYINVYTSMVSAPPIGVVLEYSGFWSNLRAAVITAAAAGVAAALVSVGHKGMGRKKLSFAAWVAAGAAVLAELFNLRSLLAATNYPFFIKVGTITSYIIDLLCMALFALLIYMLCTLKRKELRLGIGAKIWFSVCVIFTAYGVIISIAAKTMGIAGALIAIAGITGYILLFASKRIGFSIVLFAVLMNVAAGVGAGLSGQSASFYNAVIPLVGLINPLITWLIIRKGNYSS